MNLQNIFRKSSASLVGVFIVETLIFAFLLLLLVNFHVHHWNRLIAYSVTLGLIMTLIAKLIRPRLLRKLGATSPDQIWAASDAIKKNTVPTDEAVLKVLPLILARNIRQIDRQRKWVPINIVLLGLIAVGSAIGRFWPGVALFGIVTALSVYAYFDLKKKRAQIERYCETLERHGIKISSQMAVARKKYEESNSWQLPN